MTVTITGAQRTLADQAGLGANVKATVSAGSNSGPISVGPVAVVVAVPGVGGSMLVEATWSIQPDVDAGIATWFSWDAGTVTANTNQLLYQATAVRFTATGQTGVGEVAR